MENKQTAKHLSKSDFSVRCARPDDWNDVRLLISDLEGTDLPADTFRQIYDAQQQDGNYLCMIAEAKGEIVACINLRMEWQLHHAARICEIMELVVRSDCRGRGIGQEMFGWACEKAKEAGCVQIEVTCNQLRHRSHHFYERGGMHNSHYKFSLEFVADTVVKNFVGR